MTVAFVVPVAAMYAALAHVDDPPAALSDAAEGAGRRAAPGRDHDTGAEVRRPWSS